MLRSLSACLLLTIALAGCKKDPQATNPPSPPPPGGGGGTPPTVSTKPIVLRDSLIDVSRHHLTIGSRAYAQGGNPITQRGFVWTKIQLNAPRHWVVCGSGDGAFSMTATGLDYGYSYNFTAFAIAGTDTVFYDYGTERQPHRRLRLNPAIVYDTMRDIHNGTKYLTVKIGNQTWMAENLRAWRYRNGDLINNSVISEQGYSEPDLYFFYERHLGYQYSGRAINDPRGLAPAGWHVPTQDEWQQLFDYVGGTAVACKALKSADTAQWNFHTDAGTDDYGFSALPTGITETSSGRADLLGFAGWYWTSTQSILQQTNSNALFAGPLSNMQIDSKEWGKRMAVRCVKD